MFNKSVLNFNYLTENTNKYTSVSFKNQYKFVVGILLNVAAIATKNLQISSSYLIIASICRVQKCNDVIDWIAD